MCASATAASRPAVRGRTTWEDAALFSITATTDGAALVAGAAEVAEVAEVADVADVAADEEDEVATGVTVEAAVLVRLATGAEMMGAGTASVMLGNCPRQLVRTTTKVASQATQASS